MRRNSDRGIRYILEMKMQAKIPETSPIFRPARSGGAFYGKGS